MLALFKDFVARNFGHLTVTEKIEKLKALDTKGVYEIMNRNRDRPKVERDFPDADWPKQWLDVANKHVDTEVRNTIFRISHEVLPTKFKIFCNKSKQSRARLELNKRMNLDHHIDAHLVNCPLCNRAEETQRHILIDCNFVKKKFGFL